MNSRDGDKEHDNTMNSRDGDKEHDNTMNSRDGDKEHDTTMNSRGGDKKQLLECEKSKKQATILADIHKMENKQKVCEQEEAQASSILCRECDIPNRDSQSWSWERDVLQVGIRCSELRALECEAGLIRSYIRHPKNAIP
ncbi:hypothetical protein HAZT_HAZT000246 [Hyalella azteca]|uniref:Uncharacterized protein n=1 Tax=Hyalella azteca TaxID=294128 RepID=A0A6A0HDJ7_HYAAZ|nr:hypothetical protein HAZT_HAZT000246 [Hyalella azteca]